MSTLSVRLPNSLHERLRELARAEGVSTNQLIATAVAEKLSALGAELYLAERAGRGSRSRFDVALSRVPDAAPEEGDEW